MDKLFWEKYDFEMDKNLTVQTKNNTLEFIEGRTLYSMVNSKIENGFEITLYIDYVSDIESDLIYKKLLNCEFELNKLKITKTLTRL